MSIEKNLDDFKSTFDEAADKGYWNPDVPNMPDAGIVEQFYVTKKQKEEAEAVVRTLQGLNSFLGESVENAYIHSYKFWTDGVGQFCEIEIRVKTDAKIHSLTLDVTDFDSF